MATAATSWRCTVCGYVHRGPAPPEFCPVCGAAQTDFEPYVEAQPAAHAAVTRWQCLNCSYIHEGPAPPEECPICGAPRDRFAPLEDAQVQAVADAFRGHLVVIGAGIAGVAAVEAFRRTNPHGTVTLLSRETDAPYYRLNLTRYLAGELTAADLPMHDAAWYSGQNIDLRLGVDANEITVSERSVQLTDGSTLRFDKLLLAAGAHPFIPPLPGAEYAGVFSLRTLQDAEQIKAMVQPGMRCVCIGGGLLGLETAGALAAQRLHVTLLEGHDWLMPRQLCRRAGQVLEQHVGRVGVTIQRHARTQEIVGTERVTGVVLEDGTKLPADVIIVATGVRPNSHLARRIPLDVDKGVVVNNRLITSHPDVLAAGDVAQHHGTLYGSWSASQYQGNIAGLNLAGIQTEFGGLPRSNTLKVLGVDMLSIGQFEPEDASYTVLEDENHGVYRRFVLHDGRLTGAILLGDTSSAARIKQAIEHGENFSDNFQHAVAADFAVHLMS